MPTSSLLQRITSTNGRVTDLETFKSSIETAHGVDLANLQAGVVANASSITSLTSQQSTNTGAIASAVSVNDAQTISISAAAAKAAENEGKLTSIVASLGGEASDIVGQLATLTGAVSLETANRTAADATLQSNIGTETATLTARIDEEASARAAADSKMCFMSIMEAEGELSVGDYPFACGFGAPSKANFGVFMPFDVRPVAFTVHCDSTDTSPSCTFLLEYYPIGGGGPHNVTDGVMDGSKIASVIFPSDSGSRGAGQYCVKVTSASGLSDPEARYRAQLFFVRGRK